MIDPDDIIDIREDLRDSRYQKCIYANDLQDSQDLRDFQDFRKFQAIESYKRLSAVSGHRVCKTLETFSLRWQVLRDFRDFSDFQNLQVFIAFQVIGIQTISRSVESFRNWESNEPNTVRSSQMARLFQHLRVEQGDTARNVQANDTSQIACNGRSGC